MIILELYLWLGVGVSVFTIFQILLENKFTRTHKTLMKIFILHTIVTFVVAIMVYSSIIYVGNKRKWKKKEK